MQCPARSLGERQYLDCIPCHGSRGEGTSNDQPIGGSEGRDHGAVLEGEGRGDQAGLWRLGSGGSADSPSRLSLALTAAPRVAGRNARKCAGKALDGRQGPARRNSTAQIMADTGLPGRPMTRVSRPGRSADRCRTGAACRDAWRCGERRGRGLHGRRGRGLTRSWSPTETPPLVMQHVDLGGLVQQRPQGGRIVRRDAEMDWIAALGGDAIGAETGPIGGDKLAGFRIGAGHDDLIAGGNHANPRSATDRHGRMIHRSPADRRRGRSSWRGARRTISPVREVLAGGPNMAAKTRRFGDDHLAGARASVQFLDDDGIGAGRHLGAGEDAQGFAGSDRSRPWPAGGGSRRQDGAWHRYGRRVRRGQRRSRPWRRHRRYGCETLRAISRGEHAVPAPCAKGTSSAGSAGRSRDERSAQGASATGSKGPLSSCGHVLPVMLTGGVMRAPEIQSAAKFLAELARWHRPSKSRFALLEALRNRVAGVRIANASRERHAGLLECVRHRSRLPSLQAGSRCAAMTRVRGRQVQSKAMTASGASNGDLRISCLAGVGTASCRP